jgi:hypothetical protein
MGSGMPERTFVVAFKVPVGKWIAGGIDFQSLVEWTETHTAEGQFEMLSGTTDSRHHHIALGFRTPDAAGRLAEYLRTFGYVKVSPESLPAAKECRQ